MQQVSAHHEQLITTICAAPIVEIPQLTAAHSERIPATFVYAGISLERTGLLSGTRGEQIAGRFGIVRTGPFGTGQQWTALIAALEDSLRLHRHQPGTLPGLDRYLHQRSHGMIGSLLWLIRSAAIS